MNRAGVDLANNRRELRQLRDSLREQSSPSPDPSPAIRSPQREPSICAMSDDYADDVAFAEDLGHFDERFEDE
eukprot:5398049-Lingulodinium_polyedra.AAC.1